MASKIPNLATLVSLSSRAVMSEKSAGDDTSRAEEGRGQVAEEEGKEKGKENIHVSMKEDVCSHGQCHCGGSHIVTQTGYKMDNVRSVFLVILMQVFIGFLVFVVQHFTDEIFFKKSMTTATLTSTVARGLSSVSTTMTTTLTTAAMAGSILPTNTTNNGLQLAIKISKKLNFLMHFACQKDLVSEVFVIRQG